MPVGRTSRGPARDSFADYVAARGDALWCLAWLLVADETRAEQMVELALSRARPRWVELERLGAVEAEVRRELVGAHLSAGDSPRRAEPVTGSGPGPGPESGASDDPRRDVLALLAALSPPQRATLVLRALAVAPWDTGDALGVSSAELSALEAEALAAAGRASPRAEVLLRALADVVPEPPYAGDRAGRAGARAARVRRRRLLLSGGVGLLVVLLVAVPVLVTGQQPDRPAAPVLSTAPVAPPVAERLVDPLFIPRECAPLPAEPEESAYPYEPDGADAVWLRFCPPTGTERPAEAARFVPDTTVTAQEIDDLLDAWVAPDVGAPPCSRLSFRAGQGTIRVQVGTLDGGLHVVDMRIGSCGTVSLDGQRVGVDGRTAFAATVALVGRELAETVDRPGSSVAAGSPVFCPRTLAQVADLARTTVVDYPRVAGLSMPLPPSSALVCRYPPAGPLPSLGSGSGTRGRYLDAADVYQLHAAYLARPTATRPCGQVAARKRYGVVVTDITGSRRTFTVDLGRCGQVRGPGAAGGRGWVAGPWLTEVLVPAATDS